MKKLFLILVVALLALSAVVTASMLLPVSDKGKEHGKAPEHSPVIGLTDGGEWGLERVDFIHYAKPDKPPGKDKPPRGGDSCYKLMGVKWKSLPVSYVINPVNPDGLSEEFVTSTISGGAEVWDVATGAELFADGYSVNPYAQYGVQNYENAIVFGDHPDSGVIGVTSVWYTRKGKQIVEFDMLLNTDFIWGDASVDSTLMDLENIAIHELGHAVGMDDIYTTSCSEVTMFGYSGYGDIAKRTLEQPDILGLQSMYGL